MTGKYLIKTDSCLKDKIREYKDQSDSVFTVISDVKGKYLERPAFNLGNIMPPNTRWWCKNGARYEDSAEWIKGKFDRKSGRPRQHAIFIWLETCNLTEKNNGTISLRKTRCVSVTQCPQRQP